MKAATTTTMTPRVAVVVAGAGGRRPRGDDCVIADDPSPARLPDRVAPVGR